MGYTRMWFHVIPNLVSLWVVSPTLFSTPALMTALWKVGLGSSWVQLTMENYSAFPHLWSAGFDR